MRVLVTGANGQVGWELQQTVPENVELFAFNSKELDITDARVVEAYFQEVKPDLVINSAAYTAVDKAEDEIELAYAVNATGAENIAKVCSETGSKLIQISTDFIFDGKKSFPYEPGDTPNPLNVYGASKLKAEQLVLERMSDALIVRTSWVYSTHGNNFVKTMLRLMNDRDELRVVVDQVGVPTYAKGLALFIWDVVKDTDLAGLFHWSDAGVASWYDFAIAIHEIAKELGLLSGNVKIIPIASTDYPSKATRPLYSVLGKVETQKKIEVPSLHWRTALRHMLKNIKKAEE